MKNDTVKYPVSDTESPIWTINRVIVDGMTQDISFELKRSDGTLHPEPVQRNQLTFVARPPREEEEEGKEE